MEQLILSFPLTESLTRENFFITGCNKEAVLWLDKWEKWPFRTLFLVGPKDSGKTHLSEVFKDTVQNGVVFEDLDRYPDKEEELFHLYNKIQEEKGFLLVTSRTPLQALVVKLKDLQSRLKAIQSVSLKDPDDELLTKVLKKHFERRQLEIEQDSFSYLLTRIDRSFKTLNEIVEAIDKESLKEHRKITVPFIRKILLTKGYEL